MHAGSERRSSDRAQLGDGREKCDLLRARGTVGFCRVLSFRLVFDRNFRSINNENIYGSA
jgi:hypothetical protein